MKFNNILKNIQLANINFFHFATYLFADSSFDLVPLLDKLPDVTSDFLA